MRKRVGKYGSWVAYRRKGPRRSPVSFIFLFAPLYCLFTSINPHSLSVPHHTTLFSPVLRCPSSSFEFPSTLLHSSIIPHASCRSLVHLCIVVPWHSRAHFSHTKHYAAPFFLLFPAPLRLSCPSVYPFPPSPSRTLYIRAYCRTFAPSHTLRPRYAILYHHHLPPLSVPL